MAAKHGLSINNWKQTGNRSKSSGEEILNLKLQDKIPYSEIRKRRKIIDIIEYTLEQK